MLHRLPFTLNSHQPPATLAIASETNLYSCFQGQDTRGGILETVECSSTFLGLISCIQHTMVEVVDGGLHGSFRD